VLAHATLPASFGSSVFGALGALMGRISGDRLLACPRFRFYD
jgi:hypothetical protein